MRINKYLSECGVCSRREADRLIDQGRVTVNGLPAQAGMQAEEQDLVCVDGKEIRRPQDKVYLKFYKPRGIVCTFEQREKHNLLSCLQYPRRVTYAGRLDKESEGLLLLTDDGDLIDGLMRARNRHEKEYQVTVDRPVSEEALEGLRKGVFLRELGVKTRPCQVTRTGERSFRIILTQGLNRQIRRMCQSLGLQVVFLKRIRIVNLYLDSLKPGEYAPLTGEELDTLCERLKRNDSGNHIRKEKV